MSVHEDDKDHGAYVRKVREGTQRYAQDLISENERLRLLVASLEGDLQSLQDRLRGAETVSTRARDEFLAVEQQNTNLANLYVASYRLHGTLEREGVLAAIQEIVANLIGSEEMGVFEVCSGRASLELVSHNGIDPVVYREIPAGLGLLGRVATTGETYVADRDGLEGASLLDKDLTACVPLKVDGTVIGVLAIFRMLPQKPQLEALDHELFELLAAQAGVAFYCSKLCAQPAGTALGDGTAA